MNIFDIRVLWVEDEEYLRNASEILMKKMVSFSNFAGSGQEALVLLRRNQYDLLITDIGLPDMSGLNLVETGKVYQYNMRVILTTGWPPEISDEKKLELRIIDILEKPYSRDEVRGAMEKVFQRKEAITV